MPTDAQRLSGKLLDRLREECRPTLPDGAARAAHSIGRRHLDRHATRAQSAEGTAGRGRRCDVRRQGGRQGTGAIASCGDGSPVDIEHQLDGARRAGRARRSVRAPASRSSTVPMTRSSRWELLLRLRGDDGELIPPGTFLHNAERFGLIGKIDRWVFGEALRLLARHHARRSRHRLEVNIEWQDAGGPGAPRGPLGSWSGTARSARPADRRGHRDGGDRQHRPRARGCAAVCASSAAASRSTTSAPASARSTTSSTSHSTSSRSTASSSRASLQRHRSS